MAPRTKMDLIKEATDSAAEGYKILGLGPDGNPIQDATGAADPQQQAQGGPTPGQEGAAVPAAPSDQADKQTAGPAAPSTDKVGQEVSASPPDAAQLQQNYDHLRSYADRTSGENAQLRDENSQLKTQVADLKSQIQILLSAQPTDQGKPQQQAAASQQGAEVDSPGDVGKPAQTSTQADNLAAAEESLGALAEEFPDTLGPLVNYLKEFRATYGNRITSMEQTFDTSVKPVMDTIVEDTKRKATEDQERVVKEHYNKIAQAYPNWKAMIFNGEVDDNGAPYLTKEFDEFLLHHEAGSDYFRMLFPSKPGEGATAAMTIKILTEFAQSEYGKNHLQTITEQRIDSAAGDLQRDRTPKPLVPDTSPKDAINKLRAGMPVTQADIQEVMKVCRGDNVKWAELWPLVQKAQSEHRIVPGGNAQLYT